MAQPPTDRDPSEEPAEPTAEGRGSDGHPSTPRRRFGWFGTPLGIVTASLAALLLLGGVFAGGFTAGRVASGLTQASEVGPGGRPGADGGPGSDGRLPGGGLPGDGQRGERAPGGPGAGSRLGRQRAVDGSGRTPERRRRGERRLG